MNSLRIVAAVLDTTKLTLYGTDGATTVLPQGDFRIRRIIDEATPQLLTAGVADVNMTLDVENIFANFEEKSSKVRLFRVAKDKLKNLFGIGSKEENPEEVPAPVSLGTIPTKTIPITPVAVASTVIEEIMANAVRVTDPSFSEEGLDKQNPIKDRKTGATPGTHTVCDSPDTIIAVTEKGHVIPGMERIKTQFAQAAKLGSTIGVEKFLERIGAVIGERHHSIEDLLKFLERGDLPIADDGCILIYKVLNHRTFSNHPLAKYADVHSSKVPQWVGARVMMDPSLVDPNRRNNCSNGLHVARRGYVGSFNGSVCVMAKLAPEDVIAVPQYDSNKMRVCGYNIIFELSAEQFRLLKSNQPLTENEEGRMLLAKALAGKHTQITHTVEITANNGGGIKVTAIKLPAPKPAPLADKAPTPVSTPEPNKKKLAPAHAIEDNLETAAPVVDPMEVVKAFEDLSFKGKAKELLQQILAAADSTQEAELWTALVEVKKASRYGWDRLGVPVELVSRMTSNPVVPVVDSIPLPVSADNKVDAAPVSEAEAKSYSQRIAKLALIKPMTKEIATSILQLKRQSKKNWVTLKVSDRIVKQVVRLTTAK